LSVFPPQQQCPLHQDPIGLQCVCIPILSRESENAGANSLPKILYYYRKKTITAIFQRVGYNNKTKTKQNTKQNQNKTKQNKQTNITKKGDKI
jgi:hypothetical protein